MMSTLNNDNFVIENVGLIPVAVRQQDILIDRCSNQVRPI